ncbi:hypothetical protein J8273_5492 [Carpediemonas membranifera]|uniref:Uncharacterized protein n=1 Tax=Carpediemonas membranifera TaxID=201153 RepID=A0A8J6E2Z3_9EUKA|nr:hypothetical protein J8273_5492 [Carpediemonas membranifera]|eukprot:KAG9392497.1 hypothetical protein J8273_5492 [Carpediemonas membranifera]
MLADFCPRAVGKISCVREKLTRRMLVKVPEATRKRTQDQWEAIRQETSAYLANRQDGKTLILRWNGDFKGKSFGKNSKGREEVARNIRRILLATGATAIKDSITTHPKGILALKELFIVLTEALDPREKVETEIQQSAEAISIQAGHKNLSKWPSESTIEKLVLSPTTNCYQTHNDSLYWSKERDTVVIRAPDTFTITAGPPGKERATTATRRDVWDPENPGTITQVALEQQDGSFKVILDLKDHEAFAISRFSEEARDVLRLQAPEAPAAWMAAWNSTGIPLGGRVIICKPGEESPLGELPAFAAIRSLILEAMLNSSEKTYPQEDNASSNSTDVDEEEEGEQEPDAPEPKQKDKVSFDDLFGDLKPVEPRPRDAKQSSSTQKPLPDPLARSPDPKAHPRQLADKEPEPKPTLLLAAIYFECGHSGCESENVPANPVEGGVIVFNPLTGEISGHGHGLFYQNMPVQQIDQARYASWAISGLPPAIFVDVATGMPPEEFRTHFSKFTDWAEHLAIRLRRMEDAGEFKIVLYAKGVHMEKFLLTNQVNGLSGEVTTYFADRLVDEKDLPDAIRDLEPRLAGAIKASLQDERTMGWLNSWSSGWQRRSEPKAVCPYHRYAAGHYHCGLADVTIFTVKTLAMTHSFRCQQDRESFLGDILPKAISSVAQADLETDLFGGNSFANRQETFEIFRGQPGRVSLRDGKEGNKILVVPDRYSRFGMGFGFSDVVKGMKGLLLAPAAIKRGNVIDRNPVWSLLEHVEPDEMAWLQAEHGLGVAPPRAIIKLSDVYHWWPDKATTAHKDGYGCQLLAEDCAEYAEIIANIKAYRGRVEGFRAAFIPRD